MPTPNTLTYNTGNIIPGSIQQGKLAMGIANVDYGGYTTQSTPGNKIWSNGTNPEEFIVIYTDSYSIGRTDESNVRPVIRKSKSTEFGEVINLFNQLPNRTKNFNDFIEAYEWTQNQGIYLIQNMTYPSIVTDDMILGFDPCFWGCYPTIGEKIWDFSGSGEYSTIIGATFSKEYGGILKTKSLSDQYIITNNLSLKIDTSFSIFTWVYVGSSGVIISEQDSTQLDSGLHSALITFNSSDQFTFGLYTTSGMQGFVDSTDREISKWYHVGLTYDGQSNILSGYVNGQMINYIENIIKEDSETGNRYFLFGSSSDISNGSTHSGDFNFSLCQVHNVVLGTDKILENYESLKFRYSD